MARPFVRRRRTLIIAVPIAAVVGFLILGALIAVLALIAWLIYVSDGNLPFDLPDLPERRRRQ